MRSEASTRRHMEAAGKDFEIRRCDDSSPSLKARRSFFLWSVLQFLEVEFEIGSEFWPEVFSALSMMVPSVYAYQVAPELASNAIFPEGVWALAIGAIMHCPFSIAYHLASAVLGKRSGYDPMCTPFRTFDLSAIHVACVAYAWALSHGNALFTFLFVLLNVSCIFMLFRRLLHGRPGGIDENIRVSCLVFLYTLALLAHGDFFHYVAVIASWVGACLFFFVANCWNLGGGWSHGIFHLMCTPFLYFMMSGVASF